ncbi:MAG TPA: hypothetical protein VIU40_07905 [Geobacteraceae bacterium]
MHRQEKIEVGVREFSKRKKDPFGFVFGLCTNLVVLSAAVAVGILGWQGYTWSQTGAWPGVRLFDFLAFLGVDLHGAYYPEAQQDPVQYAQAVLELPATVVLPLAAFLLAALVALLTRHGK